MDTALINEGSNNDLLRGELALEAPAFMATIKRSFKASDVPAFAATYRELFAAGFLNEAPVRRAKGVSFNPRPARLGQIVLQVWSQAPAEVVLAALLSVAQDTNQLGSCVHHDTVLIRARTIATTSQALLAGQLPPPHAENSGSVLVAKAHILDKARHLHMTTYTPNERLNCDSALAQPYAALPRSTVGSAIDILVPHALARAHTLVVAALR